MPAATTGALILVPNPQTACPAWLAAGDSLWDAARYANAAAALSTTGFGAVAPLPRPDAVKQLLAGASF